ncbi:hypothetical protein [Bradyrhizobium sp. USDA 3650]
MLEKTLSEDGFGVLSAASGEEGIRLLGATLLTRALVTDINLGPGWTDGSSPAWRGSTIPAAQSST